jgi:hypothetical protein
MARSFLVMEKYTYSAINFSLFFNSSFPIYSIYFLISFYYTIISIIPFLIYPRVYSFPRPHRLIGHICKKSFGEVVEGY